MKRTEFIQRAVIALWSNVQSTLDDIIAWECAIKLADAMPADLADDDDERKFVLQEVYDRLANEHGDDVTRAMQIVTRMMEWCK